ncbi:MAG: hypothetical protein HY078_03060 [Elusimicrobia bacterium]|nr:hypothetical protein [Elusimicrobiota bacterium]
MEQRTFKIVMSERCFRFKPDALPSHAPRQPGVYEFVMFDANVQPIVLFVGLALPGTVYDALAAHMMGNIRPSADDLFRISKDIYFDYVASADVSSPEDLKDIAGALVAKHKPRLNPAEPKFSSGQYAGVQLQEVE